MRVETERTEDLMNPAAFHALLRQATEALRMEMESRGEIVTTRLDAMDRAAELLHSNLNRMPSEIDREITHIRQMMDERTLSSSRHLDILIGERHHMYEQRFRAQETALAAALAAQEKAIEVAEVVSRKWREDANEWRGAMQDREQRFFTKDENSAQITSLGRQMSTLDDKVQALTAALAGTMTRSESQARYETNAEKIGQVSQRLDRMDGRSGGLSQSWAIIVAVVMAAIALGTLITIVTRN